MFDFLDNVNPLKKEVIYLRCKECGHKEIMNKELVAKIAGIAVTAFGCKAWVGFLFAGTGFAFAICAAIVIGGIGILAYADKIALWFSERYECPICKAHRWELVPKSTLLKEKEMVRQKTVHEYDMNEQKTAYETKIKSTKIKHYQEKINMEHAHKQEIDDISQQHEREKEELILKNEELTAKIKELRSSLDEKIQIMEMGKCNEPLNVDQLRDNFWNALKTCKKELDIYVPFIGKLIEKDDFVSNISFALSRGVTIKIRCGLGSDKNRSNNKNGTPSHIRKAMESLKKQLCRYSTLNIDNLKYEIDDAHCKLLIVDDEYYILASMNFLSYEGRAIIKDGKVVREQWKELGEKSSYYKNLLFYRNEFFNF